MLGLPPAFALSQDQTLKLDENFSRPVTFQEFIAPLKGLALERREAGWRGLVFEADVFGTRQDTMSVKDIEVTSRDQDLS